MKSEKMNFPCIYFTFHNDLQMLLSRTQAGRVLKYVLKRRASLKDIIESQGIPHTEVGQIFLQDTEVGFDFIPEGGEVIDVLPFTDAASVFASTLLRPRPARLSKFMADINVKKLARNLRMLGLDTTLVPEMRLADIGYLATSQQRILITRNRELLKCNSVVHGHLLRSENHIIQLEEVVKRYQLKPYITPFTRCINCNGELRPVTKQAVYYRLEPLTRKYFDSFKLCADCEKIYWQGSHHEQMRQLVERVL